MLSLTLFLALRWYNRHPDLTSVAVLSLTVYYPLNQNSHKNTSARLTVMITSSSVPSKHATSLWSLTVVSISCFCLCPFLRLPLSVSLSLPLFVFSYDCPFFACLMFSPFALSGYFRIRLQVCLFLSLSVSPFSVCLSSSPFLFLRASFFLHSRLSQCACLSVYLFAPLSIFFFLSISIFYLFMATTADVWIIPSFNLGLYVLHVEYISCVITDCGNHSESSRLPSQ